MTGNLTEIALELNRESRFDNMPRVIFMTDNEAQPFPEDVIEKLPSGSMVILRDYDHDDREEDENNMLKQRAQMKQKQLFKQV